VRVTVPRALPTDDVLILRERRPDGAGSKRAPAAAFSSPAHWTAGTTLELVQGLSFPEPKGAHAVVLTSLEEVRHLAGRVSEAGATRAVIAPFIPSGLVPLFAGAGVLALAADRPALDALKGQTSIAFSPLEGADSAAILATLGQDRVTFSWLA